jgi:DNA-binding NarL/FixJ family response regulator
MEEAGSHSDQPLVEPLTDRELEVLSHLAKRRTNREFADELVLSLNTVKWYARQIHGELGDMQGRRLGSALLGEAALAEAAFAAAQEHLQGTGGSMQPDPSGGGRIWTVGDARPGSAWPRS